MAVNFSCVSCFSSVQSPYKLCGGCFNVCYCRAECQRLDWSYHKIFCRSGESQELASQRRRLCLDIIQSDPNFIRNNLFHYFCVKRTGFVVVRQATKTYQYYFPIPFEDFKTQSKINIDNNTWLYLQSEVIRTEVSDNLIVLYYHEEKASVYLVGGEELAETYKQIERLPDEIIKECVTISQAFMTDMIGLNYFLNNGPAYLDPTKSDEELIEEVKQHFEKLPNKKPSH